MENISDNAVSIIRKYADKFDEKYWQNLNIDMAISEIEYLKTTTSCKDKNAADLLISELNNLKCH